MAVQLQMSRVSMNTPRVCMRPALAGWFTWAAAAAQGAEPEPASLEKRPRFAPFIMTAPSPPLTAWRRPKASEKIRENTSGSCPALSRMMTRVMKK